MKVSRRRTVLLPVSWVVLGVTPVLLLSVASFVGLVVAYPGVPESFVWYVEAAAAVAALMVVSSVWWFATVTRRSFRLERELARIRAGSGDSAKGDDGDLSSLGAVIHDYGAELSRLSTVKTGRIRAQQTLIHVLMRSIADQTILVLSGTGTVLYASAHWMEEENGNSDEPEFEPVPAAMASHLLAGNGPGSVTVNGREMVFAGVFGRTVATPGFKAFGADDFSTTLVYIIISDEALSVPQTKVSRAESDRSDTTNFGDRIRSFLKRR